MASMAAVTRSITSSPNNCLTGIGYPWSLRRSSEAPVAAISTGTSCQYSKTTRKTPAKLVDIGELVKSMTANAAAAQNPYQIKLTIAAHPMPRRVMKLNAMRH